MDLLQSSKLLEFSFYHQIVVGSCNYPGVTQGSYPAAFQAKSHCCNRLISGYSRRTRSVFAPCSISTYSSRNVQVGVRRFGAAKQGGSDLVERWVALNQTPWWGGRETYKWLFTMSQSWAKLQLSLPV